MEEEEATFGVGLGGTKSTKKEWALGALGSCLIIVQHSHCEASPLSSHTKAPNLQSIKY